MKTGLIKIKRFFLPAFILFLLAAGLLFNNCRSTKKSMELTTAPEQLQTFSNVQGRLITINFEKGASFNYPLMAIWAEDPEGKYLQTLYVAKSIAKGVFEHGDASEGKWLPGPLRRPAALPYWGHKRGIQAPDGLYIPDKDHPMPDAVTGATPQSDFILTSRLLDTTITKFIVLFEINQTWDWNQYWHNNRYPDDDEYKTSCQPAVVYAANIDLADKKPYYELKPVGHSHYSGQDGKLYTDLSTLTTALEITKRITVRVK